MSQSGKRRETQRSQRADSNLSSAFEGFSRSLDKHSQALDRFMDDFERTTSRMTKDFQEATGRSSGSGHDRGAESALEDIHHTLDRSEKATEKGLSTLQKTGQSIETIIKNIGSLVVNEIRSAYSSAKDTYKSHLSSITAQMQWSNDRYAEMWNELSAYFQGAGLNNQFSGKDFVESLETFLSEGLRGETAEELAFHSMISNKLVPAISTNTIAYRRMSKVFGEEFNKNTTAFAKYTESILGAEGFSEGRFDAMMDTLHAQILYASGGDSERAKQAENNLTAVLSWMEKNNLDAQAFIDDLYSAATGQIGSASTMQFLWGAGTPEDVIQNMMSSEGISQLLENYVRAYSRNSDNVNALVALTNGLEGNINQSYLASAYVRQGGGVDNISEDLLDFINGYDEGAVYDDLMVDLKKGFYQTADDALTKQEENMMTWSATATSGLARFDEALDAVTSTLWSLAQIWIFSKAAKGAKGLLGGGAAGGASGAAGAAGGSGLLNFIAGPGALIAGGALMIGDGISTGVENQNVGAGLLAAVTGDSNIGLTEDQMLSKAKNTVNSGWVDGGTGIDWMKVGSNALKGTAIGAGVGTAAAGWAAGIGTAIGAGVGAITGAVASIIDQAIESAKYNKLVKASGELEKSLTALKEAQLNFTTIVAKGSESLSELNNWEDKSSDQRESAFKDLKSRFPDLLSGIEDQTGLTKDYIEVLDLQIKKEMAKAAQDLLQSTSGVNLTDTVNAQKAVFGTNPFNETNWLGQENQYIPEGAEDALNMIYEDYQKFLRGESSEHPDINQIVGKAGAKLGNSKEIYDYLDRKGYLYTWEAWDESGNNKVKMYDLDGEALGTYFGGPERPLYRDHMESDKAYLESTIKAEEQWWRDNYLNIQNTLDGYLDTLHETYSSIVSSYKMYANEDGTLPENFSTHYTTSGVWNQMNSAMDTFEKNFNEVKKFAEEYTGEGDLYDLSGYFRDRVNLQFREGQSIWPKINNRSFPSYKVGLNTVPYDDYLANLHAGEMVLTAENAEKLRSISSHGSGLSGLLSTIESLSRATVRASTVSSESLNINPVVDAIGHQTESIVSVLNSILEVVSRSSRPGLYSSVPKSVIAFEGL